MKIKMVKLFLTASAVFLVSCNTADNAGLETSLNDIKDDQKLILKKLETLDKAVANVALASKNQPTKNQKQQPPKTDPNKVYNIEIGDSFTLGPENAKVTLIEWMDFQ